jgi:hypothetical protein
MTPPREEDTVQTLVEALAVIAQSTHHIWLDGKGTHTSTCPPCVAAAALAKAHVHGGREAVKPLP